MTHKALTLADLPKEYLVGIIEAIQLPVEEELIAGAIIRHRLHRASRHAGQYRKLTAEAEKKQSIKQRRELEIQAHRHAVNFTILFESALNLAQRYGLKEKYFKGWTEKEAFP